MASRPPRFLRSDVHDVATRGARRFGLVLLLVLALFLTVFIGWASQATIDEITRGPGRIIPVGQNRVVQHLEGGIITEILVKEGETVRDGQVLLRIDSTPSTAQHQERLKEFYALTARRVRLTAEADGDDELTFPKDLVENAPEEAESQREEFRTRTVRFRSELDVLEQRLVQREQELREVRSSVARLAARLGSLRRELEQSREDHANGVISRHELERTERLTEETQGQLRTEQLKVPRISSAIAEARATIKARRAERHAEIRKDLSAVETKLSTVEPSIGAGQDRVERTSIRSPVNGIVNKIGVTTIGAVVKPGEPLVEIVPIEDTLLVEARILPQDRAFLRPDQPATVKLTAFDYSIYGGLDGRVVEISADALQDEQDRDQTYYRIRIRTDSNYILYQDHKLPILPGMTASVDIRTGQRTVLDYVLGPVRRTINEALSER